jgi:peptidylprolyl isomerase
MKHNVFFLLAFLGVASCNHDITGLGPSSDPATETFAPSLGVDIASMTKQPNGVYYQDVVVGAATAPEVTSATSTVTVNYAGYLKDGTLFDSGAGAVFDPDVLIPGFRTGMMGMREGGKRKIVIPSEQGYGGHSIKNADNRTIKIPRQSTLVFDVEITKVTNPTTTT